MLPVATPPNAIAHEVNPRKYLFCLENFNIATTGIWYGNLNNDGSWFCPQHLLHLRQHGSILILRRLYKKVLIRLTFSRWRSTPMPSLCSTSTHSQIGQIRLLQEVVKQTICKRSQETVRVCQNAPCIPNVFHSLIPTWNKTEIQSFSPKSSTTTCINNAGFLISVQCTLYLRTKKGQSFPKQWPPSRPLCIGRWRDNF